MNLYDYHKQLSHKLLTPLMVCPYCHKTKFKHLFGGVFECEACGHRRAGK